MPFRDVLEAIAQLSLDEQATLVEILQHRVAEQGRKQLVAEVQAADQEFAQGICQPTTADDLMAEILS